MRLLRNFFGCQNRNKYPTRTLVIRLEYYFWERLTYILGVLHKIENGNNL